MLECFQHWECLYKIFFNTLLVTLPETFYVVMFTLLHVGEFDYWKEDEFKRLFHKWDYRRVFLPVVISAFIPNIIRYTGIGGIEIIFPVTALATFILLVITGDIWNDASALKWSLKVFLFLMVAYLSVFVIETAYAPFVLQMLDMSLEEMNSNIQLNFLASLPSRAIEYMLFFLLILRKKEKAYSGTTGILIKNKSLTIMTIIIVLIDAAIMIVFAKLITYKDFFSKLNDLLRILTVLCICLIPLINVAAILFSVYFVQKKEFPKYRIVIDKVEKLASDVKIYINKDNKEDIRWKLNEIDITLEEVSAALKNEDS